MKKIFILLGLLLLFMIIFPIVKIFWGLDLGIFRDTLGDSVVLSAVLTSLECALYATFAGAVLGIPAAYIITRYDFPGKGFASSIINIPVVIPHSAAGIALLSAFASHTFFGAGLAKMGLSVVDTKLGVSLGMFFLSVPFLINHSIGGFSSYDQRIEKSARVLGAGFTRTFFTISLPLAKHGIIKGFIMMWARGISEFGAVVILAYHPLSASVLIFERFGAYGLKYTKPIASLLILICLLIFIVVQLLSNVKNKQNN